MSIHFSQSQVDGAVTYLMTGGPGVGELTTDQYQYMTYFSRSPQIVGSILSDFAWQLQLAINAGHAGITNSKNLCRDKYGAPADAFQVCFDQSGPGGIAFNEIVRFRISIAG